MKIEVFGKNGFTPSDANKEYAVKKLAKLEQFFGSDDSISAKVVCKVYREFHKVEITIPTKNLIMRAEVTDKDLYAAIDLSIDKLTTQVRKHKDKVKSKMDKEGLNVSFSNDEPVKKEAVNEAVRKKIISLVPMDVEEAVHQMELLGHDFFIYLDENSHEVNVLYVRHDGDYAIIETK